MDINWWGGYVCVELRRDQSFWCIIQELLLWIVFVPMGVTFCTMRSSPIVCPVVVTASKSTGLNITLKYEIAKVLHVFAWYCLIWCHYCTSVLGTHATPSNCPEINAVRGSSLESCSEFWVTLYMKIWNLSCFIHKYHVFIHEFSPFKIFDTFVKKTKGLLVFVQCLLIQYMKYIFKKRKIWIHLF